MVVVCVYVERDVETPGISYFLADSRRWGLEEGKNLLIALLTSEHLRVAEILRIEEYWR